MLTRSGPYRVRLLSIFVLTTVSLSSFAGAVDWSRIISDLERQPRRSNSKQQLAIAYNNYAIELSNQGSWGEAEAKLEKALALDGGNAKFKKNLACALKTQDFGALSHFRPLIKQTTGMSTFILQMILSGLVNNWQII